VKALEILPAALDEPLAPPAAPEPIPGTRVQAGPTLEARLEALERRLILLEAEQAAQPVWVTHAELEAQNQAVQSLRMMVARTDELLEQVIENIESMSIHA
jgi:hypothetical protein